MKRKRGIQQESTDRIHNCFISKDKTRFNTNIFRSFLLVLRNTSINLSFEFIYKRRGREILLNYNTNFSPTWEWTTHKRITWNLFSWTRQTTNSLKVTKGHPEISSLLYKTSRNNGNLLLWDCSLSWTRNLIRNKVKFFTLGPCTRQNDCFSKTEDLVEIYMTRMVLRTLFFSYFLRYLLHCLMTDPTVTRGVITFTSRPYKVVSTLFSTSRSHWESLISTPFLPT